MATSSQGSTFTFRGSVYTVTSVTVEGPTPEIVDMTPPTAPLGQKVLVPTGDATSTGRIQIDGMGFGDPLAYIATVGQLVFATPMGTISRQAICDSVTVTGQTGDLLRFQMSFTPTDYYP